MKKSKTLVLTPKKGGKTYRLTPKPAIRNRRKKKYIKILV